MGADRLRVLGTAAVSVALAIAATLVFDWFLFKIPGMDTVGLDLRTVHGCGGPGVCASVSLSKIGGLYPTLSKITFFTGIAFAIAVAITAGRMLLTEDRQPSIWSKAAYTLGSLTLFTTFLAAYMFAPSMNASEGMMTDMLGVSIEIERTWAPLAMISSVILGFVTVYFTRLDATTLIQEPVVSVPIARVVPKSTEPPPVRDATPVPSPLAIPPTLHGKIRFAIRIAEVTRGGIDARREDGTAVLVMWRDIIGAVARRLPKELEGHTFVDIVSTAGATLRLLPWSRLNLDDGRVLDDQTDARRALAILAVVSDRCPDITFDPATRAFIETRTEAAQLPDLLTLAAHDEHLA